MKLKSLHDLYVDELKDLYSAENQLVKALPSMAKAADSQELKRALEEHLRQTQQHAKRLEKIFEGLDAKPRGKKCVGMEGLIEEGKELLQMRSEADPAVLDAGLIGAAQRVEHYEIAGYGTARTHAEQLGHRRDAEILQQTLDEESAANEKLTQIAEGSVNREAEYGEDGMRQSAMMSR
jgi:ferritin-like metal-binding protein YciE